MDKRAFTLIEMTVVITVLALMAALIVPNMVAIKRSREVRVLEAAVRRLPSEAREEARRTKGPIILRVEGQAIVMESLPQGEDAGNDPKELKRVALSDDLRLDNARQGADAIDVASWKWVAYPDGSAGAATLVFQEGRVTKSLRLFDKGEAQWIAGDDAGKTPIDDRWPVGDLEHRG